MVKKETFKELKRVVKEKISAQVHQTIPAGRHRYQADVETFHDIVEREFFEIETFSTRNHFMRKIYSYSDFR